jgi:ABC-type bacteriocin/lantibiotic exporter with double-glycine peptidase domain
MIRFPRPIHLTLVFLIASPLGAGDFRARPSAFTSEAMAFAGLSQVRVLLRVKSLAPFWQAPETFAPLSPSHRRLIRTLQAALIFDSVATVAATMITQGFYDAASSRALEVEANERMAVFSILFLVAEVVDPFRRWVLYRVAQLQSQISENARLELVHAGLQGLSFEQASGIASRLSAAAAAAALQTVEVPSRAPAMALHVMLSGAILSVLDPTAAVLTFVVTAALTAWNARFAAVLERRNTQRQATEALLQGRIEEVFGTTHRHHVRAHGLEEAAARLMRAPSAQALSGAIAHLSATHWAGAVLEKTTALVLVSGVTWMGLVQHFLWGSPSIGHLVAVLTLSWHVYFKLTSLLELERRRQEAEALVRDWMGRLSLPERPKAGTTLGAPPLELQNLLVTIEGREVLNNISLRVEAGAALLISGASGAGKTTLLRVLAGVQAPTSGDVRILGMEPGAAYAHLVYIAQDAPLMTSLTIREHLALMAPGKGTSEQTRALEAVGLGRMPLERSLGSLSGGERLKIAMAAAWLRRPALLLLDEPAAPLDAESRKALVALLGRFRKTGIAIVLVSHDPLREVLANRFRLDQGRLIPDTRTPVGRKIPPRHALAAAT